MKDMWSENVCYHQCHNVYAIIKSSWCVIFLITESGHGLMVGWERLIQLLQQRHS